MKDTQTQGVTAQLTSATPIIKRPFYYTCKPLVPSHLNWPPLYTLESAVEFHSFQLAFGIPVKCNQMNIPNAKKNCETLMKIEHVF